MKLPIGTILRFREASQSRAFEASTRDPASAQAAVLHRLLVDNAETAFGRTHAFSELTTPDEYARSVPLADYEAFRPFVKRIIGGEKRVLSVEDPYMFTTTSGTTGEPKLLP